MKKPKIIFPDGSEREISEELFKKIEKMVDEAIPCDPSDILFDKDFKPSGDWEK